MHGWGGWRGQLGSFVEPLVAAGFRVIAFDVPHGVIAHSYGCATATTAIRDGLVIGRLVCVSPSVDPMTNIRAMSRALGIGPRTLGRVEFLRAGVRSTGAETRGAR
jgi:pimeloyl-ACP methyl ester carboxylesterase